jgi:ribosomal subunit interface protein
MNKKTSFHNMPHSDPLEAHTIQKLDKVQAFVDDAVRPFLVEVWLKANKSHPHHAVEVHLKTPSFDLHSHTEGTDMYVAVDNAIDKIVSLLIKEKKKTRDKNHKVLAEKRKFFGNL